jgi:hypothetical protein
MMEVCKQSPAMISSLFPRLRSVFQLAAPAQAVQIAKALLEQIDDFARMFVLTDQFFPFMQDLVKLTGRIKAWDSFEPMVLLFIALLRKLWSPASPGGRRKSLEFVQGIEEAKISVFAHYCLVFTGGDRPAAPLESFEVTDSWNKREVPLVQMADLFIGLMTGRGPDWRTLQKLLTQRPVLWVAVAIWGVIERPKAVRELLTLPRCPDPFMDLLFRMMMIRTVPSRDPWRAVIRIPDVDVKLWFPPPVTQLRGLIEDQLMEIAGCDSMLDPPTPNIVICWRAWMVSFGSVNFLDIMLGYLKGYAQSHPDHDGALELYKIAAMILLSVACPEQPLLFAECLRYVGEELEDERTAIFFSWFVMILASGRGDEGADFFVKMLEACERILMDANSCGFPTVVFALSIIKLALRIPNLRPFLQPRLAPLVIKMNDWETAVDFCTMLEIKEAE